MKTLHSFDNFLVSTNLKGAPAVAGAPLKKIKETILGKKYNLSLIFVGSKRIKKLNFIYRDKNSSTDILSFAISKEIGEIFISPKDAKSKSNSIPYLLIHGCLHLKGLSHGSRMNSEEKRLSKHFKLKVF